MNERQRYIETLKFGNPDRIPFFPGGPRESTLTAWHSQGLPAGANWYEHLCETIGIDLPCKSPSAPPFTINSLMVPQFEEKVIERRAGSLIVQDWKGNICEISDEFDVTYLRSARDFVTRRWLRCPVETWDDWQAMKERYHADDPNRFPANWEKTAAALRDHEQTISWSLSGVFWQLREWLGFEGLCERFLTDPELVADMAQFWSDFLAALLEKASKCFLPDEVIINEDMAYKEKTMISPALTREYILPAWQRWGRILKKAGCPLYSVDSDGHVGSLIPLWIEAGFDVNMPQEFAAGNDLPAYRQRFGRQMGYMGGVDKREMAKGGDAILQEMKRLEPAIRAGGYIPGCDHGIPSDVSWPCMVEYSRILAQMTGWV